MMSFSAKCRQAQLCQFITEGLIVICQIMVTHLTSYCHLDRIAGSKVWCSHVHEPLTQGELNVNWCCPLSVCFQALFCGINNLL